jgi:hypothetical protein
MSDDHHRARMAVKRKTLRWRITRIRGNRAELLGVVTAADEKSAIKTAIKDYKIERPDQQRRLAARLED